MADVAATITDFHGWDAVHLSNGLIEAVAVPEIGGRLMQFKLGSYEYLFRNPELLGKRFTFEEHAGDGTIINWKNYGGEKTWPAPQGWDHAEQWPGPPDPILDGGRYSFTVVSPGASVTMISPPDKHRTGLRITRTLILHPDSARLQFDMSFENVVDHPIRWSVWQNAQLNCEILENGQRQANTDCWLYIPSSSQQPYHVIFGEKNKQLHDEFAPGLLALRYLGIVGKIGVPNPVGWIAFADQAHEYVLCMKFVYEQGEEYPDHGASVECWTESPGAQSPVPIRSPGYLLEAEILSPLRALQPGGKSTFSILWCAACCPGPIFEVTDAGCVHKPLAVSTDGRWAKVDGIFGCFEPGHGQLVWLDENASILQVVDLGAVSPMQVLHVSRSEPLPQGAASIHLNLVPRDGRQSWVMASASLG